MMESPGGARGNADLYAKGTVLLNSMVPGTLF
jgi:hypothetical protein